MRQHTIIWDFDGTILPTEPYDSEQSLLIYKLNDQKNETSLIKRWVARFIIYADMKEWIGKYFKKYYIWVLKGTHINTLDEVAKHLAEKISEKDRQIFFHLKANGHYMMIISCGTLDLSERILKVAGVDKCFELIEGNRFQIENNKIVGMDMFVPKPEDKLKLISAQGVFPEQSVVVGDGYTDLPLLDRAGLPVMIDRTGEKKDQFANKGYSFISSICEIMELIEKGFE